MKSFIILSIHCFAFTIFNINLKQEAAKLVKHAEALLASNHFDISEHLDDLKTTVKQLDNLEQPVKQLEEALESLRETKVNVGNAIGALQTEAKPWVKKGQKERVKATKDDLFNNVVSLEDAQEIVAKALTEVFEKLDVHVTSIFGEWDGIKPIIKAHSDDHKQYEDLSKNATADSDKGKLLISILENSNKLKTLTTEFSERQQVKNSAKTAEELQNYAGRVEQLKRGIEEIKAESTKLAELKDELKKTKFDKDGNVKQAPSTKKKREKEPEGNSDWKQQAAVVGTVTAGTVVGVTTALAVKTHQESNELNEKDIANDNPITSETAVNAQPMTSNDVATDQPTSNVGNSLPVNSSVTV